jgi:CHASE1-domain containing sensor protein
LIVLVAFAVLAVGMGVTLAAVIWVREGAQARAQTRFDRLVERVEADIQQSLSLPFFGLKGAAGVYAASDSVERSEFRAYVESSRVVQDYPGVRGFGFVERVKRPDMQAFIARQKRDASPGFSITTQSLDPELYVIKFMEPASHGDALLGLDIGPDPVRRQAIDRAVETGQATLSGRTYLMRDIKRSPAVVLKLAV